MKLGLQFGGLLLALGISAGIALPSAAQKREASRPPQQQKQPSRPAPRQERHQPQQESRRPQGGHPNFDRARNSVPPNRPAESMSTFGGNRPPNMASESGRQPNFNPNRPPNATVRQSDLTPRQRENLPKLNRLTPQERQEIKRREAVWSRLTPEQQNHIKNDIVPKWQQMSPNRQKAVRQRLGVLQNMPEFARNQHLNDPNFTRGMSEEDKAMLRDLGHMHVGAPDPPNE